MTRVWNNGKHQENGCKRNGNHDLYSETNVDMKDGEIKLNANNCNKLNKEQLDDEYDETDDDNEENKKKSFFRLCCSETLEKDLTEQSKVMLNMIYFFQILPFYILQFTSGMALGK